jgi:hypothetical protein
LLGHRLDLNWVCDSFGSIPGLQGYIKIRNCINSNTLPGPSGGFRIGSIIDELFS